MFCFHRQNVTTFIYCFLRDNSKNFGTEKQDSGQEKVCPAGLYSVLQSAEVSLPLPLDGMSLNNF